MLKRKNSHYYLKLTMDRVQQVKTEAEELLKKMIGNFEVEVEEDGGMYQVIIKTDEEAPTVIGRHGETIRAVQKILEVILYKSFQEPIHLLVNVNDYREKQRDRLQGIAAEMVGKVQSTGRSTHLRGLSSYERKIVHEYITETYPELTTYSIGEGRDRHPVIDLKSNESAPKTGEGSSEEE